MAWHVFQVDSLLETRRFGPEKRRTLELHRQKYSVEK